MYIIAHLFMSLLGKVHVGFLSSAPVWSYFFPKASPQSRQSLGVFLMHVMHVRKATRQKRGNPARKKQLCM